MKSGPNLPYLPCWMDGEGRRTRLIKLIDIYFIFININEKVTYQIYQIGGSFSKVVYRNNSIGDFMKRGSNLVYLVYWHLGLNSNKETILINYIFYFN